MKKRFLLTAICALAVAGGAQGDDVEQLTAEARGIVKQFFGALKGELEGATKKGGPVAAIAACNVRAPAISSQVSLDAGWDVSRTSLKLRQSDNVPDTWEKATLEQFETRKAEGDDLKTMEHSQIVEADGARTFRYMKAIPTADLCLTCHGSEIPADVAKQLDLLYPDDAARGFKAGDIRGAFSLSKQL